MTSSPWQKFSARQQGLPASEVLHEGVPDHLEQPMRAWIYDALQYDGAQRVALRLEIQIRPEWTSRGDAWWLAHALNGDQLLDVIDAILGAGGPWPALHPLDPPFGNVKLERAAEMRGELQMILAEGRSAYRINDDHSGLVRRVDATVTAAAAAAIAAAASQTRTGSAADRHESCR